MRFSWTRRRPFRLTERIGRDSQVLAQDHITAIGCVLNPPHIFDGRGHINAVALIHGFERPTSCPQSDRNHERAKTPVSKEG